MTYRTDIDGLRSIAVLLVIINHAGFSFLPGGFIGVDVFFVLSGFLITSIIAEKAINNNFNYGWFFVRRIKRLLPASFVVVAVSMVAFTLIMLPEDLVLFYKSIIWVSFYLGNFFFWREHGGYFGGSAEEAPLLHTWSLAVEEQYYLIWPIILISAFRWLGLKKSLPIFIVIFIVSTIVSEWGTRVTLGAAYYLLPTRFFELMAGSLLALYWHKIPSLKDSVHHIFSIAGIVLVIFGALYLHEDSRFPGFNALIPVAGTVLLIISSAGLINRLLSLKPFVFTGQISYSMYLWHWPIFTYCRYSAIELTLPVQIATIALTFVLATLSWKYVEQPLRYSKEVRFQKVGLYFFLIPSLIISSIALVGIVNKGFPERFTADNLKMSQALTSYASESRKACHSPARNSDSSPKTECIENTSDGAAELFIFGDSHANHFVPFVHVLTDDANLSSQDYTLDQCAPIFDLEWGRNSFYANKCRDRNSLAKKHIENHEFKFVVLAASWPSLNTGKIHQDGIRVTDKDSKNTIITQKIEATIKHVIANGAIPIIIEDNPDLGGKSPKCPLKKELFNSELNCEVNRPNNDYFSQLAEEFKVKFPSLKVIKPRDLICEGDICQMSKAGIPLFRDDDHLNEYGAIELGKIYIEEYGNPLKQ